MLSSAREGDTVRVHYRPSVARFMALHGKTGRVVVASRGRPRNHGVEIDGVLYVIPAGNLCKEG
jgi:ribosomal protein L21E